MTGIFFVWPSRRKRFQTEKPDVNGSSARTKIMLGDTDWAMDTASGPLCVTVNSNGKGASIPLIELGVFPSASMISAENTERG